jgi:predicted nucleic acid-binding protein
MKVLVDSSAWIEYFKGNSAFGTIDQLLDEGNAYTNEVILSELLPSIEHRKETALATMLQTLPQLPTRLDWSDLRLIQILNLKKGTNKVGLMDIAIAQHCIQNNLPLLTADKHFRLMAVYLPIELLTLP